MEMDELKEEGNKCLRAGQLPEAIQLYTEAIDVEATAVLYSNRSNAYLKAGKHWHAQQDAMQAVHLSPMWSKGYFRLGEVYRGVGQHLMAVEAYKTAVLIQEQEQPGGQADPLLDHRITNTKALYRYQYKLEENMPWVCAGVGLIVAVVIIVADYSLTKTPALTHVLVQTVFTVVLSVSGLGAGKVWVWYTAHLRAHALQPPLDQQQNQDECNGGVAAAAAAGDGGGEVPEDGSGGGAAEQQQQQRQQHPRYTKAQARQRFKKGRT